MSLRLAFMGTPEFAVPTLAELVGQAHEMICVYTQPPRPKGRGLSEEQSPVQKFAANAGIEVRTPASLKSAEEQAAFAALKLDAAVVVAYGLILPKPILVAPRLGCFNLHASLLPRWRGAAPIQRAIMAGDEETGVMVMRMDEGLDTGPVLMAKRVAIARKTYGQLHDGLAQLGAGLIGSALSALEHGIAQEKKQSNEGAVYANKITKEETRIDWKKSARELDCRVRALSPAPGAWFEAKGERIKVICAEPVASKGAPAEVVNELTIACGDGALKLLSVQRAGKAPMDADSFLRGFPLAKGECVS
jgi:methionyl-tRNA formyltransferase